MNTHPWAREIKAFVDGNEVECRELANINWRGVNSLNAFNLENYEFRIKPKQIIAYTQAWIKNTGAINCFETQISELEFCQYKNHNLKLTFEAGTNKLIKAEVI